MATTADASCGSPLSTLLASASSGWAWPETERVNVWAPPGPVTLAVTVTAPVSRSRMLRCDALPKYDGPFFPTVHSIWVASPVKATVRTPA